MAQSQSTPPIPPLPGQQAAPGQATQGAPAGGVTGGPATTKSPNQTAREISEQIRNQVIREVQQGTQDIPQPGTPVIGVPTPPVRTRDGQIPGEIIPLFGITFGAIAAMVICLPIARALARAIDRRSEKAQVKGSDVQPQLRQLQESVDAMAIELERISESQRFQAKLLADRAAAIGSGEERR